MTHQADRIITVVIPTFNRRANLQKAAESVLSETRVPIRLHIFDNASTDETEAYVQELAAHDSRVIYTRRPENIGATGNYAGALAEVATEYFVPLADDDWLLPDFLHDAHRIMEEHKGLGAAVFVTEARNQAGTVLTTYPGALDRIRLGVLHPREHLEDWLAFGHYAWSSVLWRSRTLECIGAPYLHVGLPSDVDFQVQIFCHFPVYISDRPGAVYSLHDHQASGGYDVSHTGSWARLFERLDREILRLEIFSRDEYLRRREAMEQRYRPCWTAPPKTELSLQRRVANAALAGFRLGDWDTAFSAIRDAWQAAAARPAVIDDSVFSLPLIAGEPVERRASSLGRGANLHAGVIGWMGAASQALERSRREVEQLQQSALQHREESARLQAENAELRTRLAEAHVLAEGARSDAAESERKRLDTEAKLQAFDRHPAIKAMRLLGLRTSRGA